jgi:peptidoglycan/xylan/chitin deacetylase (PgdA/CDA1 family)
MSYKKMSLIVLAVIAIVVGGLVYVRDHVLDQPHEAADITDLSGAYQATDEIAAAKQQLADGVKPAEVITTLTDGTPRVAIVFDGLPDRPSCARLLDVLARHDASAVFFVEGQNAADQPETIKMIQEAGQEIGNYTYVGLAGIEKASSDKQLSEICRTQKIVSMLSAFKPELFRAPRMVLNDNLLKSVQAAGLSYAVKENVRFQPNTLHNDADADAYAASIANGSILAIQVNRPVDPKAVTPGKTDERPAVDMKPTIHDNEAPTASDAKEDLADEVDRLLTALSKRGIQVIFVNQFRKIHYVLVQGVTTNGK